MIPEEGLAAAPGSDASLGTLIGRMTADMSRLFHDELELAKVEIKEEVTKTGKAVGFLGGTGVAGLFGLLMASFAAAWGLAEAIPVGFAFLIIAALYVAAAGVLYLVGRRRLAEIHPIPEQTVATVKEDVEWVKQQRR